MPFCCMWLSSFSSTISWKDCLRTLENKLTIYMRVYFLDPFSVPLVSISIFYASTTTIFDYCGFLGCSETKRCETSSFVLLLYDHFLTIWDPLKLHMNLRVGFPYQKKKKSWSWSSNTLAAWWEELTWKDPDAGKDWRQEEKGMTEDKMVGWHHQLNGHEFE